MSGLLTLGSGHLPVSEVGDLNNGSQNNVEAAEDVNKNQKFEEYNGFMDAANNFVKKLYEENIALHNTIKMHEVRFIQVTGDIEHLESVITTSEENFQNLLKEKNVNQLNLEKMQKTLQAAQTDNIGLKASLDSSEKKCSVFSESKKLLDICSNDLRMARNDNIDLKTRLDSSEKNLEHIKTRSSKKNDDLYKNLKKNEKMYTAKEQIFKDDIKKFETKIKELEIKNPSDNSQIVNLNEKCARRLLVEETISENLRNTIQKLEEEKRILRIKNAPENCSRCKALERKFESKEEEYKLLEIKHKDCLKHYENLLKEQRSENTIKRSTNSNENAEMYKPIEEPGERQKICPNCSKLIPITKLENSFKNSLFD